MIVTLAKVHLLVLTVDTQHLRVLLCHPCRACTGGGSQDYVNAALPQPVNDLIQPGKVVHAILRLQPCPSKNSNGNAVHMRFLHQLHVFFQDVRSIQPLVRVVVSAVEKVGETRGKFHEAPSLL